MQNFHCFDPLFRNRKVTNATCTKNVCICRLPVTSPMTSMTAPASLVERWQRTSWSAFHPHPLARSGPGRANGASLVPQKEPNVHSGVLICVQTSKSLEQNARPSKRLSKYLSTTGYSIDTSCPIYTNTTNHKTQTHKVTGARAAKTQSPKAVLRHSKAMSQTPACCALQVSRLQLQSRSTRFEGSKV